jgi:hypothetical protein
MLSPFIVKGCLRVMQWRVQKRTSALLKGARLPTAPEPRER